MKKSIFSKVGAAAVVLTLVTASLVGGTFAKYTSTVTATGKATVAKWAVAMKANDQAIEGNKFEFSLVNKNPNAVTATDKIGPESYGEINMTVDGTGSEVGFKYEIIFDVTNLGGVPIKFYSDATMETELTYTANKATMEGTVAQGAITPQNKTVYWKWVSQDDTTDTGLGTTPITGTIGVTMTASQLIETATQPTN